MESLVFRCITTISLCCQVTSIQQVYYSTPVPTIIDEGATHYIVGITSLCSKTSPLLDSHFFRLHLRLRYATNYNRRTAPKSVNIGMASYDVCHNSSQLLQVVSELLLSKTFRTDCVQKPSTKDQSNVICLVSYMTFSLTKLLTQLLSGEQIPIFANADGDISTFENINPSFFSTYIMRPEYLSVIDEEISHYRIKHVSLVIIRNKKLYFISRSRQIMWELLVKHPDICISMKDLDANNYTEIENYMYEVQRGNYQMIIIWYVIRTDTSLDGINNPFGNILNLANTTENRIWYWILDYETLVNLIFSLKNLQGTHIFTIELYSSLGETYWEGHNYDVMLEKNFEDDDDDNLLNDTWISRYIKENNLNKTSRTLFSQFNEKRSTIDAEIEASFMPITIIKEYSNIADMWKRINESLHDNLILIFDTKTKTTKSFENYADLWGVIENNFTRQCERKRCVPGYESKTMYFQLFE